MDHGQRPAVSPDIPEYAQISTIIHEVQAGIFSLQSCLRRYYPSTKEYQDGEEEEKKGTQNSSRLRRTLFWSKCSSAWKEEKEAQKQGCSSKHKEDQEKKHT